MSLSRSESRAIASRYVAAIFDLAADKKKQDQVCADLLALKTAIDESAELRQLIHNPMVKLADKAKAFEAILKHFKADALTAQCVTFVINNKRVEVLADIAVIFEQKLHAFNGELSAEVITAKALSAKQKKAVEAALKKAAGKDVNITEKEDASIIGGMIIKMGSRMLDRSVAGKLERLKLSLTSAS